MTTDNKRWWMSKTIFGAAAAIISGLLGLSSADTVQLTQLLTDVASVAGGALAVYGRVKATRAIR